MNGLSKIVYGKEAIRPKFQHVTGTASATGDCQRRAMNKKRALKDSVNLRIEPSMIVVLQGWNSSIWNARHRHHHYHCLPSMSTQWKRSRIRLERSFLRFDIEWVKSSRLTHNAYHQVLTRQNEEEEKRISSGPARTTMQMHRENSRFIAVGLFRDDLSVDRADSSQRSWSIIFYSYLWTSVVDFDAIYIF